MEKANVSKFKNNLSRYLAYVRKGGRVVIFNRDAPVAELVPIDPGGSQHETTDRHLERLERQGIVARGTGKVPEELLTPPEGSPSGALEALLEERASGR